MRDEEWTAAKSCSGSALALAFSGSEISRRPVFRYFHDDRVGHAGFFSVCHRLPRMSRPLQLCGSRPPKERPNGWVAHLITHPRALANDAIRRFCAQSAEPAQDAKILCSNDLGRNRVTLHFQRSRLPFGRCRGRTKVFTSSPPPQTVIALNLKRLNHCSSGTSGSVSSQVARCRSCDAAIFRLWMRSRRC